MRPLWALLLAVVITACSDDGSPTNPSPPPAPGIGAISIIAATSGSPPDPDGYMLTMDDTLTRAIGVNGTITFSDLVGRESHSFALTGLAANCTLASDNPLLVQVIGGETVPAGFHIACTGTTELRDQIVFISNRDGPYDVYAMNTDGSNPIRLTDLALSYDGLSSIDYPIVSPDGRKIAFTVTAWGSSYQRSYMPLPRLHVIMADGSSGLPLFCMGSPTWAPNATMIAYSDCYFSERNIHVSNADGSGQTTITNSAQLDWDPMWSPDGTKIVFCSSPPFPADWREGDIWVIGADGTGPMKLTDYPAGGWAPAWSPDGTKIAFVSNRDGNDEIYVMNADGTGQTNLSNNPDADGGVGQTLRPAWSPDGSKILFQSRWWAGGVYVMNADGTNPVLMPNSGFTVTDSWSWSPNGSKFVFEPRGTGMGDIWTMNTDGTGLSNLTDHPARDYSPTWTP